MLLRNVIFLDSWDAAFNSAANEGYTAVSLSLGAAQRGREVLHGLLSRYGLGLVLHIASATTPATSASTATEPDEHLMHFRRQISDIATFSPLLVVSCSGRDHWSSATATRFFEGCIAAAAELAPSVRIVHATAPGSGLGGGWQARALICAVPGLRLHVDLGQIAVDAGGLGRAEMAAALREIAAATSSVVLAVGHAGSRRTPHPGDAVYGNDLRSHLEFWSTVQDACNSTPLIAEVDNRCAEAAGVFLPITKVAMTNLAESNRWLVDRLSKHLAASDVPLPPAVTSDVTEGDPDYVSKLAELRRRVVDVKARAKSASKLSFHGSSDESEWRKLGISSQVSGYNLAVVRSLNQNDAEKLFSKTCSKVPIKKKNSGRSRKQALETKVGEGPVPPGCIATRRLDGKRRRYRVYSSLDDETVKSIATQGNVDLAAVLAINKPRIKGLTTTAKLMEGTLIVLEALDPESIDAPEPAGNTKSKASKAQGKVTKAPPAKKQKTSMGKGTTEKNKELALTKSRAQKKKSTTMASSTQKRQTNKSMPEEKVHSSWIKAVGMARRDLKTVGFAPVKKGSNLYKVACDYKKRIDGGELFGDLAVTVDRNKTDTSAPEVDNALANDDAQPKIKVWRAAVGDEDPDGWGDDVTSVAEGGSSSPIVMDEE